MLPYLPKYLSDRAVIIYLTSLVAISLIFGDYAMSPVFMVIGVVFVLLFFYGAGFFGKKWLRIKPSSFTGNLFWIAFFIRFLWVLFSYVFYLEQTGRPFEWNVADAFNYHDDAAWLATCDWKVMYQYLFLRKMGVSDAGYHLYLTYLYKIIGPNILLTRIIKAVIGSWTCVLVYKLSSRLFGESTGRMAAVFCMLMPNLIYYCGLHLKEIEMDFLVVAFLERTDNLVRRAKYDFLSVVVPICLAFSLFLFRTVLGVVALLSFVTVIVFSSRKIMGRRKKLVLVIWSALALSSLAGGTIMTEVEEYWNLRVVNEEKKRSEQVASGMKWAKYATGAVMAPMIFSVPFATMVDTGQYNQMVLSGGNYVKTFMSVFVFIAFYFAIRYGKWRDFLLIGVFTLGYLMVIAFSGYANSERFHMPTLPCVLMIAAYGVSQFNIRTLKFFFYWATLVFVMNFAWAFFKLGGRGLI